MDILFFAAIAFYVFWKLREQFGRIDEEEKKQIKEKFFRKKEIIAAVQNQVMAVQKKIIEQTEIQKQVSEKILSSLDSASQEQFRKILTACNISAEFFILGAKSTFEIVLKSFAASDLAQLKLALSDKVYSAFEREIISRKLLEQNLITNVIAIDRAEISSISLIDNIANVTIKLTSRQINYITDKDGAIIEGRKDEIKELSDIWTFRKDITATAKNWVISAT